MRSGPKILKYACTIYNFQPGTTCLKDRLLVELRWDGDSRVLVDIPPETPNGGGNERTIREVTDDVELPNGVDAAEIYVVDSLRYECHSASTANAVAAVECSRFDFREK